PSCLSRHPTSPLFPYTTLFRSPFVVDAGRLGGILESGVLLVVEQSYEAVDDNRQICESVVVVIASRAAFRVDLRIKSRACCDILDRNSTRLNSSHLGISYAVFC